MKARMFLNGTEYTEDELAKIPVKSLRFVEILQKAEKSHYRPGFPESVCSLSNEAEATLKQIDQP